MNPASNTQSASTRKSLVFLAALLAAVLALIVGVSVFAFSIQVSRGAETRLQASLAAADLVREYVSARGEWPRSWRDLEALPPRENPPRDLQQLKLHVVIDFTADLEALATQPAEQFNAVRPIGPCYPYKDHAAFAELLEAVRSARTEDGPAPRRRPPARIGPGEAMPI